MPKPVRSRSDWQKSAALWIASICLFVASVAFVAAWHGPLLSERQAADAVVAAEIAVPSSLSDVDANSSRREDDSPSRNAMVSVAPSDELDEAFERLIRDGEDVATEAEIYLLNPYVKPLDQP